MSSSKTIYKKSGSCVYFAKSDDLAIHQTIPTGTYMVKHDKLSDRFYLESVDDFVPPEKIYGDYKEKSKRIINTFKDRGKNTGVMMIGEKGSGKSLLAKMIAVDASKYSIPTLIVASPYTNDTFVSFIMQIDHPVAILFDEFDKNYDKPQQSKILSLLDGTSSNSILFLFTGNERASLNYYINNRPGRIYYWIEFDNLEENFVKEYCEFNLNNKQHIDKLVQTLKVIDKINFDMLQALVEEMNRYNESPVEALKMLNIKPGYQSNSSYSKYACRVFDKETNKAIEVDKSCLMIDLRMDILNEDIILEGKDDDSNDIVNIDLAKLININGDVYTFESGNYIVKLIKQKPRAMYNWLS